MWKIIVNKKKLKAFPFPIPYVRISRTKIASLVVVKEEPPSSLTISEQAFVHDLLRDDLYPSVNLQRMNLSIPIALVPFRFALLRKEEGVNERKVKKRLQKKKWNVFFYHVDELATEQDRQMIKNLIYQSLHNEIGMNVSSVKSKGLTP